MKLSKISWIFLAVGIALAIIGFMLSDKEKYPIGAKFSGVIIILGIMSVTFALATEWNPINKIT